MIIPRVETLQLMEKALCAGLDCDLSIVAPLGSSTKVEVAQMALDMGIEKAIRASWSCYQPVSDPPGSDVTPCGTCPACTKRQHAFKETGIC